MKPELGRLPRLIDVVEREIAALPMPNWRGSTRGTDFLAAVDDLRHRLAAEHGAHFEDGDGTRVALAGIRSHSTMGTVSALRNWLVSARRRLEPEGTPQ